MTNLEWIMAAISILGAVFNVRGRLLESYLLWLGSNAAWTGIHLWNRSYPSACVFGAFAITTVYGLWRLWRVRRAAGV